MADQVNVKVNYASPYVVTYFGDGAEVLKDWKEKGKEGDAYKMGCIVIDNNPSTEVKTEDYVPETKFETPDPALDKDKESKRPPIEVKKPEDIEKRKEKPKKEEKPKAEEKEEEENKQEEETE